MKVLFANDVSDALYAGLRYILTDGQEAPSRNGSVLVSPVPVTTVTYNPTQRVLFVPGRNDNPFFHFIESLWMLAGRKDLAPLLPYVKRMADFSDDGGKTQPGAYGYRWRKHFVWAGAPFDQLDWAVNRLKTDPNDRRVVISMWDGKSDPLAADNGSKDVPCNTQIYLRVREPAKSGELSRAELDMTVTCRSNDLLLGAHGANAVHFSVLQEYLASRIGVGVGRMYQVSNNYHLYTNSCDPWALLRAQGGVAYRSETPIKPYPLFDWDRKPEEWDEDLEMWWNDPAKVGLRHSFFTRVATPIFFSHKAFRDKSNPERFDAALEIIDQCAATDWKLACRTWLARMKQAADDGPQK
ncbi:MAG: hypothetical protein JWN75_1229 [Candidatus Saccharibacteria bacterium]|nr:hypothetical protein [Candidatus Saccharibacteria bacterium]MDB5716426.1 hypothetical protein [Sphingomonadales bacterium]